MGPKQPPHLSFQFQASSSCQIWTIMLKQLEEIRGLRRSTKGSSSYAFQLGTHQRWPLTSPTPRSMEKHCRPINHVIMESEVKGSLVERLDHVESWIVKVTLAFAKMEEDLEAERKRKRKPRKEKRWFTKLLKGGGAKHRPGSDALV